MPKTIAKVKPNGGTYLVDDNDDETILEHMPVNAGPWYGELKEGEKLIPGGVLRIIRGSRDWLEHERRTFPWVYAEVTDPNNVDYNKLKWVGATNIRVQPGSLTFTSGEHTVKMEGCRGYYDEKQRFVRIESDGELVVS